MEFDSQFDELLEVVVLYVCINPEQPFHNQFDESEYVLGQRLIVAHRKVLFGVVLIVDPVEQILDLFSCADLDGSLHLHPVCPELLLFGACSHGRTALGSAKVHEDALNVADFFEKLFGKHDYPVGLALALRHILK